MLDWDDIDDDLASLFGEEPDLPSILTKEVPGPSGADMTARANAKRDGQRLWEEICANLRRTF